MHALVALSQLTERGKRVRAQLVQDARDEVRELLVDAVAVDGKGVGGDGGVDWEGELETTVVAEGVREIFKDQLTLRGGKVDDIAVALEHVDLLDLVDRLHVQLLQSLLELLVVGSRPCRRALDLSPGRALATVCG